MDSGFHTWMYEFPHQSFVVGLQRLSAFDRYVLCYRLEDRVE